MLVRELTALSVIRCFILPEKLSGARIQGIIEVRVCEQRRNRKQHLLDVQSWRPLAFQNVQTYATLLVHIWMPYSGLEVNLRWLHGILLRQTYLKFERAALVGATFRTCNR